MMQGIDFSFVLLVYTWNLTNSYARVCGVGEFGNSCNRSCHCADGMICDVETGDCRTPGCLPGWKGNACSIECEHGQYGADCVNICHCQNGAVCNKTTGNCPHGCDVMWTGDNCSESGNLLTRIKHNVTTTQSDTFWSYNSSLAIDGVQNYSVDTCQCCSVAIGLMSSWWQIDLGTDYLIDEIALYGRSENNNQEQIEGARVYSGRQSLHSNPSLGQLIYTVPGSIGSQYYFVHRISSPVVARFLLVTLQQNVLVICEFLLHELKCSPHNYGNNCSLVCGHCKDNASCHHVNGSCQNGCAPGYQPGDKTCTTECSLHHYGNNCSQVCGHCKDNESCHHVTGSCPNGCAPGYQPEDITCKTECSPHYYGNNCSQVCGHCNDTASCHHINGSCQNGCAPGYHPTDITCKTACNLHHYGNNCSQVCGHCKGNASCHHVTGSCQNGCAPGYQPGDITCKTECSRHYYGNNCSQVCGHCKDNASCHHITGSCQNGCATGYQPGDITCTIVYSPHHYGNNCSQVCGHCKDNASCHHVTGSCQNGCSPGYQPRDITCKTACSPRYYGNNCSQVCGHCKDNVSCHHVTGSCQNGCAPGYDPGDINCTTECCPHYYGNNCSQVCGHCKDNTSCHHVTGPCLNGCSPGYQPADITCKTECSPHFYGNNCSQVCGHCKDNESCHHVTGSCPNGCAPGYQPEDITCKTGHAVCPPHDYGNNCTQLCGHCKDNVSCHHVTGSCENRCAPGYDPRDITCNTACFPHYYGNNCSQVCGHCKDNAYCHHVTGSCEEGCAPGYQPGDITCKTECVSPSFGFQCNQTCHCINGSHCNNVDGSCDTNQCADGWKGFACNEDSNIIASIKGNASTSMSSVYNNTWESYLAVDGNIGPDPSLCKCCARTNNAAISWWSIDLRQKYPIRSITLYGRNEVPDIGQQLEGFQIFLSNTSLFDQTPFYKDNSSHVSSAYTVEVYNQLARFIKVQRPGVLTLCEVSVQEGECATGYFGNECSRECKCLDMKPCSRSNGVCSTPFCQLGWRGMACDSECLPGTFGEHCRERCFCAKGDICTRDYGICPGTCDLGYQGPQCNKEITYEQSQKINSTAAALQKTNSSLVVGISVGASILVASVACFIIFKMYRRHIHNRAKDNNTYMQSNFNIATTDPEYDTLEATPNEYINTRVGNDQTSTM